VRPSWSSRGRVGGAASFRFNGRRTGFVLFLEGGCIALHCIASSSRFFFLRGFFLVAHLTFFFLPINNASNMVTRYTPSSRFFLGFCF